MSSHVRTSPATTRITTSPGGHRVWDGAKWAPARRRDLGLPVLVALLLAVSLSVLLAASVAIVEARDGRGVLLDAAIGLLR